MGCFCPEIQSELLKVQLTSVNRLFWYELHRLKQDQRPRLTFTLVSVKR